MKIIEERILERIKSKDKNKSLRLRGDKFLIEKLEDLKIRWNWESIKKIDEEKGIRRKIKEVRSDKKLIEIKEKSWIIGKW